MYKQVCIFMYVFVCMHVYVCICTHACMYTCVYVHVCMYVSLLVTLYLLDNKHFLIEIWIKSTAPNVARTISCKALNSPAKYPSWVARCDRKGSDGIMLNPISWKKVQGQKHSGRWGIVEHQIPSIKVLFKINAKSQASWYWTVIIREQDTIGKPEKSKSGIQPRNCALPRNTVLN